MLKAIAFDLWETLISYPPEAAVAHGRLRLEKMQQLLAERGVASSAEHRCQELYWSVDKDIPCRTQIDHFVEALQVDSIDEETLHALEHAYANAGVEIPPSLVRGAADILPELKRRGYLLGLISNTGRTPGYALRTILERMGLLGHFDAMVFSNEHGECKPQRSIFEALRQSLGVDFQEMLFVGDNLYVDVHGAQRCGMLGVHFIPPQRGTAIAPPVEHGLEIVPDATITHLRQLSAFCDRAHAAAARAEARSR